MVFNFILVFLLGAIFAVVLLFKFAAGTLKVYVPEDMDESPYLYVELESSVGAVCKKKYVLFRVDTRAIHSLK